MNSNTFGSVWSATASWAATLLCAVALSVTALSLIGCQPPTPPTAAEPAQSVSPASFDQTINQDNLVLVKFGATWCPPCRDIDRELLALDGQLPADVDILKIDVDENPELMKRYGVTGIPKLLLVRDGKVLAEQVGYMSGKRIQSWIGQYHGGGAGSN